MSFESDLLAALGAPDTFQNATALTAWEDSEGTPPQDYNPLAITDPQNRYPHAGIISSNGGNPVYAFPDQATGVRATADFIKAGYPGILTALQSNAGYAAIYRAINQSSWCKGCQGGHYPARLFQFAFDASQGSGVSTPGSGLPTIDQQKQAIDAAHKADPCVLALPNVIGLGGNCILHRSTLRKIGGGALVAAGGFVMLVGTVVIISRFGRLSGASRAFSAVPGVAPTAQRLPKGWRPMQTESEVARNREDTEAERSYERQQTEGGTSELRRRRRASEESYVTEGAGLRRVS